jgi:hypothetical protein
MSINKITYLDQFHTCKQFIFADYLSHPLYFSDFIEVKQFLELLEYDKVYVLTLDFIINIFSDEDIDENPVISLTKPILVTRNSNSILISKFILNRIYKIDEDLDLNLDVLKDIRIFNGPPYIFIKYNQINLF